jgi:hypothetical protein
MAIAAYGTYRTTGLDRTNKGTATKGTSGAVAKQYLFKLSIRAVLRGISTVKDPSTKGQYVLYLRAAKMPRPITAKGKTITNKWRA